METTAPSRSSWRLIEGLEAWTHTLDRNSIRARKLRLFWQLTQVLLVGL